MTNYEFIRGKSGRQKLRSVLCIGAEKNLKKNARMLRFCGVSSWEIPLFWGTLLPPPPFECLDGRGVCKNALQNLEPQGFRGQNLDNKELAGFSARLLDAVSALNIGYSFGREGKLRLGKGEGLRMTRSIIVDDEPPNYAAAGEVWVTSTESEVAGLTLTGRRTRTTVPAPLESISSVPPS
jgi:hypothetical protein